MKKIIKVVNSDTGKIIYNNENALFKDNESVLLALANSKLDLSDNYLEIFIRTIKDDFKVGDYCYYSNKVCKILKIDNEDDTARVLLFEQPIKSKWVHFVDIVKIDNEDLEEATND